MATVPEDQQHMLPRRGGYASPEAMLQARQRQHALEQVHAHRRRWEEREPQSDKGPLTYDPCCPPHAGQAPPLAETTQEPRQWTLITLKRCVVTKAEFQYWGAIEIVLEKKGFPTRSPDDGTILLSWFDDASGQAYYELARVQDPGELASYMLAHFHPQPLEGVERLIQFPEGK